MDDSIQEENIMRIGTIGTGFIVSNFINASRSNENCEVVACYSRKLETGEAFAAKNGVNKVYTDLNEMLNDETIDTIYVASPNSVHYEQAKMALNAGKNVICEKPFTSTSAELKELIALAKEKQLYLFEAIIPIHLPNFKWLKTQLDRVGELKIVQCNFSQYSSKYDAFKAGKNPNVFNTNFSGGALMDINMYNIHFVMGLFGKPEEVHYFANKEEGIDTSGVVIMKYPNFVATCVGCKDSKSKNLSQIQGNKGYFLIEQESSRVVDVVSNFSSNFSGLATTYSVQENSNGMHYELKDFLEIVENNDYEACWNLLDYSLDVLEVIEACRKDAGVVFAADNK